MQIVDPKIQIMTDLSPANAHIAKCARTCYQSMGEDSKVLMHCAKNRHWSVFRHFSVTVNFLVDRGITHEMVRHGLSDFSQESTRYCRYEKGVRYVLPFYFDDDDDMFLWSQDCEDNELAYLNALKRMSPQRARYALNNSVAAEIKMTANLEEWRNVFSARGPKVAHPQFRQIVLPLMRYFQERVIGLYDDLDYPKEKWEVEVEEDFMRV